ncbi:hypothetical protein EVAR_34068_1 [Eumeta japonica]|uniref:Uncharacterized protein n=1 Tax=Eumeta variegata TaxID=151549 RepID=A0A4C1WJT4_EUMVA|nr:hypothetical protein EVAR_34068_1 [Eumeta japonica]
MRERLLVRSTNESNRAHLHRKRYASPFAPRRRAIAPLERLRVIAPLERLRAPEGREVNPTRVLRSASVDMVMRSVARSRTRSPPGRASMPRDSAESCHYVVRVRSIREMDDVISE